RRRAGVRTARPCGQSVVLAIPTNDCRSLRPGGQLGEGGTGVPRGEPATSRQCCGPAAASPLLPAIGGEGPRAARNGSLPDPPAGGRARRGSHVGGAAVALDSRRR